MRILTSSYSLDPSGVPTYTQTMVTALHALGHDVVTWSPFGGKLLGQIPGATTQIPEPTEHFDVILAQHTPCARALRLQYPHTPLIYCAHGYLPEIDQPPLDIRVDGWTAINERVFDHLVSCGVTMPITIVRDFIDTEKFSPTRPVRLDRPHVLFISNYKKWKNWAHLSKACAYMGYPLTATGAPYGRVPSVADAINEADVVVSWGRGILEGMSCGRPVISFDQTYGDGYLTEEMYYISREHQFSSRDCTGAGDWPWLVEQLKQYNPTDGARNRALILQHHAMYRGVDQLLTLARKVIHAVRRA